MVNGLLYLVKVVSCKKCLVIGMNPSVSGKGLKSMLFMFKDWARMVNYCCSCCHYYNWPVYSFKRHDSCVAASV